MMDDEQRKALMQQFKDEHAARDNALLQGIKAQLPRMEELLNNGARHWEDRFYRFYHHSAKVFDLQEKTEEIVEVLRAFVPGREMNDMFLQIIREGTGHTFSLWDNTRWPEATRPIVEAFFHARMFLELAVHYGKTLEEAPTSLPSGWAALLYLYDQR